MPKITEFATTDYETSLIHVTQYGIHRYTHKNMSTPHTHPVYEIGYVLNGAGELHAGGKEFPFKKDDFLIITPNANHYELTQTSYNLEIIFLQFTTISEKCDLVSALFDKTKVIKSHNELMYYKLFVRISDEVLNYNSYTSFMIDLITSEILVLLYRNSHNHQNRVKLCESATLSHLFLFFSVKGYISANLENNICVSDIEQYYHVTYGQLNTIFKTYANTTIKKYILNCKIDKAKELLTSTQKSLSYISDTLGFSDASHFHKVFKEFTSTTPMQYREQNQPK